MLCFQLLIVLVLQVGVRSVEAAGYRPEGNVLPSHRDRNDRFPIEASDTITRNAAEFFHAMPDPNKEIITSVAFIITALGVFHLSSLVGARPVVAAGIVVAQFRHDDRLLRSIGHVSHTLGARCGVVSNPRQPMLCAWYVSAR